LFDAEIALCAGAILATTLIYQDQALDARVDMTLCFFILLSLAVFYALSQGFLKRPVWYYLFFAITGIGTLAKGPLGILLPALVAGAFAVVKRRWDWIAKFSWHPGVILAIVLGTGWYVLAVTRGGEGFFDRQIVQENLNRFVGGSGHSHPIYYYVSYLFSQAMPWGLLLPLVLWDAYKKTPYSDGLLFLNVWCVVMFVFFSLSVGKRPVYLLPIYPAVAILTARWFLRGTDGKTSAYYCRGIGLLAGITGLILLIVVIGDLWNRDPTFLLGTIDPLLKPRDRANYAAIKSALSDFGWSFTAALLIAALLWFSLARCLWTHRLRAAVPHFVAIAVVFSFVARGVVVPAVAATRSYRPFMSEVGRLVEPGDKLYIHDHTFNSDAVVFYHGEPVEIVDLAVEELVTNLGRGKAYMIMAEADWRKAVKRNPSLPPALLKSEGKGPDNDAPLVLVRYAAT
jgi:hypothetical protein